MPSSTVPDSSSLARALIEERCEHLADDRGALEHRALDRGQAVESRRDQRLDRGRHLHLRQIAGGDPSVVLSHEIAVVDQHRDHLFDEQRIALGGLGHARRHARRRPPSHRSDRRPARPSRLRSAAPAGSRSRSRRRRPSRAGRHEARAAPARRRRIGASRDHSATCSTRSRNVGLGPLEIVEEQQEWLIGGEDLEESPERPERLLDGRLRLRETDQARDEVGDTLRALARPDHVEQFPLRLLRRVEDREPGRLTHQLDDRPERDALPVGEAPPAKDRGVRVDLAGELLHQPRLPGTGRSQDREEMTRAIRRRRARTLARSSASSRSRPTIGASSRRACPAAPAVTSSSRYAANRLRLALGRDRIGRLRPDRVAGQPIGLRTDQDLAGRGRLLETGGGVDGVAGHERLPGRGIARDDLAGVHADPRRRA